MFLGHRTAYSGRTTRNQHRIIQALHFSFPRLLLLGISDPLSESLCSSEQIYVARNEAGANRLFAGWCSHYNFRNGVGVKNSPMPRLQFTKRFVIVRNSDFRAPVVREFDILGTPNPKLVARKRDNIERFERVRLGQFSQLLNHSRARIESGVNFSNTL